MTLTEAKELLIKTLRERESVHYVLGYLTNSYLMPQDDDAEKYIVRQTLAKYDINAEIED